MRDAFIRTLTSLAQQDENLYLLSGDLGFKVFDDFRYKCPRQFLNMGVAESLMVSVAAGLALEGKKPFIYSIASFLTMRPYEHIRNDICFHKAGVVLVAAGGGFSYGLNGASHHALTDVTLMRALPEMTVFTPADPHETIWAVKTAYGQEGPSYIRLGRSKEPCVHEGPLNGNGIKQGIVLREGNEVAILVSGFILPNAVVAAEELMAQGYSVRLISFPLIKPLSEELVRDTFEQCVWVFTVEEHSLTGGFSAAVMELAITKGLPLDKLCPITATAKVVTGTTFSEKTIHEAGSHDYLRSKAGLSSEEILQRMQSFMKKEALC